MADFETSAVAEAQEFTRLSEAALDLPARVQIVAAALARNAPSPQAVRAIRPSGLVLAPTDREPRRHGD